MQIVGSTDETRFGGNRIPCSAGEKLDPTQPHLISSTPRIARQLSINNVLHKSVEEYIPNIASNPLAQKVKRADLRDNLDVTRLTEIDEDMFDNIQKYHKSLQYLKTYEDSAGG